MGDEVPFFNESFEDGQDLEEEIQAALRRAEQLLIIANAAEEHLYPKAESIIQLANHLRIRNELRADKRDPDTLSDREKIDRHIFEKIAAELDTAIEEALDSFDHVFLRRLSKAAKLLQTGAIRQPVDLAGAIVLAFAHLKKELGRSPNPRQVRVCVDQWFREGDKSLESDHQWRKVLTDPFIAALFRDG